MDVAMVNIVNDILDDETNIPGQETEGEAIELQDLGQDVNLGDVRATEPREDNEDISVIYK